MLIVSVLLSWSSWWQQCWWPTTNRFRSARPLIHTKFVANHPFLFLIYDKQVNIVLIIMILMLTIMTRMIMIMILIHWQKLSGGHDSILWSLPAPSHSLISSISVFTEIKIIFICQPEYLVYIYVNKSLQFWTKTWDCGRTMDGLVRMKEFPMRASVYLGEHSLMRALPECPAMPC